LARSLSSWAKQQQTENSQRFYDKKIIEYTVFDEKLIKRPGPGVLARLWILARLFDSAL
jgi:hypothetical protein